MIAYPLYPTRNVRCLDGLWDFQFLGEAVDLDRIDIGSIRYADRLCVPGAFDAMPAYAGKRGTVAYRTTVPATVGMRGLLKFHGLGMWCRVYVDGKAVHQSALPYSGFSVELPVAAADCRQVVILIDNRFDFRRVPLQEQFFDFYAYGGIFRSVESMEVPETWLDRVRVTTEDLAEGRVSLRAFPAGRPWKGDSLPVGFDGRPAEILRFRVLEDGSLLASARVPDPTAWTPEDPRLHTVRVSLPGSDGAMLDSVVERFGLRTVRAEKGRVLLNGKPVKLLGYCRHEASMQYGPALPLAQLVADMQYLKDLGCNFVRGSHYPQDPRWLDLCDERGLLVFEESMGWGQRERQFQDEEFRRQQVEQTRRMVRNSCNHPSVILWGFLNEGQSNHPAARPLYRELAETIRAEDPTRLVTYASMFPFDDVCFDLADLISVNQYPGWYARDKETVRPLGEIAPFLGSLTASLKERGLSDKPVIISEMGAGALYGWRDPLAAHWTEDYQADYLAEVCSQIVAREEYAGISIWQFADCRTYASSYALGRPRGINDKGTLDEYRRPKLAYKAVKAAFRRSTP